ncbi:hypothetical protein EJB05_01605, partial [Eragrostis curvula]
MTTKRSGSNRYGDGSHGPANPSTLGASRTSSSSPSNPSTVATPPASSLRCRPRRRRRATGLRAVVLGASGTAPPRFQFPSLAPPTPGTSSSPPTPSRSSVPFPRSFDALINLARAAGSSCVVTGGDLDNAKNAWRQCMGADMFKGSQVQANGSHA